MLVDNYSKTRGDTLIEVLFAITIFSLVAVGSISIMNQGTAISQRSLEITLNRHEIDAQAETLRFLNASYIAAYKVGRTDYTSDLPANEWLTMSSNINSTSISKFNLTDTNECPTVDNHPNAFIMDTHNAKYITTASANLQSAKTFAQVQYKYISASKSYNLTESDGIWIEAIHQRNVDTNINADYIDFNIRACWDSPGQSVPITIGTIVRLYEPLQPK
jgi:prepilin-type N-terminal cleavage/methylation domain-containing protein